MESLPTVQVFLRLQNTACYGAAMCYIYLTFPRKVMAQEGLLNEWMSRKKDDKATLSM